MFSSEHQTRRASGAPPMTYYHVDDQLHGDHRLANLPGPLGPLGLLTLAGSWAAANIVHTDGQVSGYWLKRLGGTAEEIEQLVAAGLLLDLGGDTYKEADWDKKMPSADRVRMLREADAAKKRETRASRRTSDPTSDRTSRETSGGTSPGDSSQTSGRSPGEENSFRTKNSLLDSHRTSGGTSRGTSGGTPEPSYYQKIVPSQPVKPADPAFVRNVVQQAHDIAERIRLEDETAARGR